LTVAQLIERLAADLEGRGSILRRRRDFSRLPRVQWSPRALYLWRNQNDWISGLYPSSEGKTTFLKLDLFPSSDRGKKTPTVVGPLERANLNHWSSSLGLTLSKGPNTVRVSLPSPEHRNTPSFLCVVLFFPGYFVFRIPSDSECYTPMSEPFGFYQLDIFLPLR
jgi:hypothetical protein